MEGKRYLKMIAKMKLLLTVLLLFLHTSNLLFGQVKPVSVNETTNEFINRQLYQWNGIATSPNQIEHLVNAAENQFTKNDDNQGLSYGFYKQKGWCKFVLTNAGKAQRYFVTAEQSRIDSVQLFLVRNGSAIEALPVTGKFQKIWDRQVKNTDFVFAFLLDKGETVQCYLYSERRFGGHSAVINVSSEGKFKAHEIFFINYFAFIIGIAVLAVMIGFVLYFFIHDKTYLFFSYYCLSNVFLLLADSGYIHSFIHLPAFLLPVYNAVPIFFYFSLGAHTFFTIILLTIKETPGGWFYKTGFYGAWGMILSGLLLILPVPVWLRWQLVYISYFIIFFIYIYILAAIVTNLKKKSISTYLYLLGFLSSLTTTSVLLLANFGLIDNINQYSYWSYGIPLIEIFCMILGLGFHFSKTVTDRFEAQLALTKSQENFTKQLFQNTEDERQRIAQDLHDGVGQDLILLKKSIVPNTAITESKISHILDQIRSISRNLHPVVLDKIGLKHTIEQYAERLMENEQLSQSGELHLYRIIQEALNNTMKHANAHAAKVSIVPVENFLEVKIIDNGRGFAVQQMLQSKHSFGLHSILERGKVLGTTVKITSAKTGTAIEMMIKL
jgi:signal transduction histidine kinase